MTCVLQPQRERERERGKEREREEKRERERKRKQERERKRERMKGGVEKKMEKCNVNNKSAQEARYHESANDVCYFILLW